MQIERKRNSIEYTVHGRYAMFADPITRVGGEKFSYQVPTYEAIKGITESIYWKPTLIWIIDAVRVMRKIQTESKGVKPIKMSGGNDLSYYTYLRDVEYQVLAHFEWNPFYPELEMDWNENKHHNIAKRCVKNGGRLDVFLGTRECQGYVEPCVLGEGKSFYDDYGELDFGAQFHGFDYPNETGRNELSKRFWHATMHDGVIRFPPPTEESLGRTFVRKMQPTPFVNNENYTLLEDDASLANLMKEEV